MGQVYRALHRRLDRQVAIKRLAPQLSHNQDMLKRFLQEARLQARLPHPNVVSIFDLIENDQGIFLIMEFVEGQTAKAMLEGRHRLTMTETIMIAEGVLCGLAFMHRNGVVHRDIKPSNIMVSVNGTVKVTDFGIARLVDEESGLTRFGGGIGTLHYMAPELIRTGAVSFSIDIYSLGAALHELLSGLPPFVGNTDLEIMMGHLEKEPQPLDQLPDDAVGQGCRAMIAKALAKLPDDRFPNAEAFLEEVRRIRALLPPQAVWPVVDPAVLAPKAAPLAATAAATSLQPLEPAPGGPVVRDASQTTIAPPPIAAPPVASGQAPVEAPAVPAPAPVEAPVAPEPAPGTNTGDRPPPEAIHPGRPDHPGRSRAGIFVGIGLVVLLGAGAYFFLGSGETPPPAVTQPAPAPREDAPTAVPAGQAAAKAPEATPAPEVPPQEAPPSWQPPPVASAPAAPEASEAGPQAAPEQKPLPAAAAAPAAQPATTSAKPAAAPAAQAVPAKTEQPSAKPEVRYVAASEARLRELPNATAPVLANLEKGTRLTVLGQENQWLKITEPGGRAGYINAQLTATSPPAASPPSPAPAVHPATVAKPVKSAAPRPAAKPGEAAPSGWRIVK